MKALDNHLYAMLDHNNVITMLFDKSTLPEWADRNEQPDNPHTIRVIDVTDATPAPTVGMVYSNENGTFSPQAPAVDNRSYADKRKGSYPPIEMYLDGVVKGDQNQINRYIELCKSVKNRFPKPESKNGA